MCKSIEGINGTVGKTLDWVRWFSQVLVIPLLFLAFSGWWNHEQRIREDSLAIAVMSGNRFTSENGLQVWREIANLQSQMQGKADLLGSAPVREDIAEMKEDIRELRTRLDKMADQLSFLVKNGR